MIIKHLFVKENIKYVFLSLLLLTDFIKSDSILDSNQFSWYYLSILNSIMGLFIIIEYKYFKTNINNVIGNTFSIAYMCFFLWALLSYFYAENNIEVLVKSGVWINALFIFLNLSILFYKNVDFKILSVMISVNLLLGVFSSFSNYWELIKYMPYDFSKNSLLVGVAGNRNVTALLFCLKLPFLIYLIEILKNKYLKILLFVSLVWTLYTLLLLGSRSSYIYFSIILFLSIIYTFLRYRFNLKSILKQFKLLYAFAASLILFMIFVGYSNTASFSNRISTIDFEETSTQLRLRFYGHGLNSFINNPIIGVGLGNWKVKSIDYESDNIKSYIVPYYLHNDFLEIAAELGIIGLILYLGIFVMTILKLFKLIYLDIKNGKNSLPKYILLLSILVYFIDSNLNFPHGRALSQTSFNIILTIAILYISKNEK